MITYKEKPDDESLILDSLNPLVKKWFYSRFARLSLPQQYGVYDIHTRQNILISAPTGATKTLTAFLAILNELVDNSLKGILQDRTYAVYISPLKALNYDIQHNLLGPLAEIEGIHGSSLGIRVGVRTGDTTAYERQQMSKNPPHILITTPESLGIMLQTTSFREHLKSVDWLIVDEIHALAENKRGVHLSLSMEMLQRLSLGICRVGLSATIAPLDDVARFLVGTGRSCRVVDVQFLKELDLKVLSPVDDLINTDHATLFRRLYTMLDDMIQQHKTTLIFTNTRAATERVVHHLKERYPTHYTDVLSVKDEGDFEVDEGFADNTAGVSGEPYSDLLCKSPSRHAPSAKANDANGGGDGLNRNTDANDKNNVPEHNRKVTGIGAHHGSLSKSHRHRIENGLRAGELKCVVCSTSLELGMDIGYIDLVVLLGSPKSVARALQRIGRSGHQLHSTTKGRIVVLDRDDLVECSVLLKNAVEKKMDRIHIPMNCLDVLAQQIYGISISEKMHIRECLELVKGSYCYSELSEEEFYDVIKYLSGDYASLEDRHVYAKIWYDPETGMIGRRGKMARVLYMTNIGTIPDQTGVTVKVGAEPIGVVDEGFLERLHRGDVFVLGGSTYEFLFSRGTVASVKAAVGKKPTVPSWFSEMLPLSYDLAQDIARFRGYMREKLDAKMKKEDVIRFIHEHLYVDDKAAAAIYSYFKQQHEFAVIPTSNEIIIEHYLDEGKKYAVFHTMLGRRVNDCLSRAVAYAVSKIQKRDVEVGVTDNGFYIASVKNLPAARALSLLDAARLRELMDIAIDKTQVLIRRFRHCAGRSLMILRNYKGQQKKVGKQQVSSMILMSAVKRISKDFPILKEARREVLEDLMDIDHASDVLRDIEAGRIKVRSIDTRIPSPFSFNLVLMGHLDMIKIEDRIEFLKRMHQMVNAKISLDKGKQGQKFEEKELYEEVWRESEAES